jgi:hypothetical protein
MCTQGTERCRDWLEGVEWFWVNEGFTRWKNVSLAAECVIGGRGVRVTGFVRKYEEPKRFRGPRQCGRHANTTRTHEIKEGQGGM